MSASRKEPSQGFDPRGFSLTELLVAIAVIGILAGILFTAIGGAREAAAGTKCLANLRSIHSGMMTVAMDGPPGLGKGPGYFPSYAGVDDEGSRYMWSHLVGEKLGLVRKVDGEYRFTTDINSSVFNNPLREDPILYDPDADWTGLNHSSHYGYNMNLGAWSTPTTRNEDFGHVNQIQARNPSKLILFAESDGDNSFDSLCHAGWAPPGRDEAPDEVRVVFVDGHVDVFTREEILSDQPKYLHP